MAASILQTASATTPGATSLTATFGSVPIDGSLLVALAFTRTDAGITGPTGFSRIDIVNAGPADTATIAYKVASGDGAGIQLTGLSATDATTLRIFEVAGVVSVPFDKSATTGVTVGTASINTGSTGTLSQAGEFAVCLAAIRTTVTAPAIDSSFTFDVQLVDGTAGIEATMLTGYRVVNSSAALNPQFSWTGAVDAMAIIATFKASLSGGRSLGSDTFHPGRSPGKSPVSARFWQPAWGVASTTTAATVSPGAATHSYVAQTPQVQARVAPAQVTHTYVAQVPQVRARVAPAQVTHTYLPRVPQVQARVSPGQATHTYLARAPQVQARVQPGAATHTYLGRVPAITTGAVLLALRSTHLYSALVPTIIFSTGSTQPGGGIYRAGRQLVIARKYLEDVLGEDAEEQDFLESVSETIKEAEKPSTPVLSREIGILSALDAITHAYNVHFETVAAARSAINERLVEFEDDDLMAVLMILAMADEP